MFFGMAVGLVFKKKARVELSFGLSGRKEIEDGSNKASTLISSSSFFSQVKMYSTQPLLRVLYPVHFAIHNILSFI